MAHPYLYFTVKLYPTSYILFTATATSFSFSQAHKDTNLTVNCVRRPLAQPYIIHFYIHIQFDYIMLLLLHIKSRIQIYNELNSNKTGLIS
jgi:hypothetical protein